MYHLVVLDYSAEYEYEHEEHFHAALAVLIFTTSLCTSLITAVPACCLAMTLSPSFVSDNQAV